MSPLALFRVFVVFLLAAVYVLIGAFHWSQPLHEGARVGLQVILGILIYGNLMVLLTELMAVAVRIVFRRPGPRLWLPLVCVSMLVFSGELAVRTNLELPPLIGLSDPLRLALLGKALLGGFGLTLLLLALPALLWKRGFAKTLRAASRPLSLAYGLQLALTLVLVSVNTWRLNPAAPNSSPNAPLLPTAGRNLALVCVDAAYWRIIEEMMDEGHLPNFSTLREQGTWGHLITDGKRLSPIVWTTLVTGVRVEKHGVAGWTEPTSDGRTIMVPSTSRTAAALWNVADAAGLSSLVLNWLITAPPEQIAGAVIPNLDHVFNGVVPATHPPALSEAVKQEFAAADYPKADPGEEPIHKIDFVERIYDLATDLGSYDLVITGTQATDDVQHRYLLHRYPELFDDDTWDKPEADMQRYVDTITETYDRVDELLGRLLADGRTIAIVSDHGARPRTEAFAVFNMNALFEDMGLARCLPHVSGERSGNADSAASVVFAAGNDAWHNDLAFFVQDPPGSLPKANLETVFAELRGLKISGTNESLFDGVFDLREPAAAKRFRRHHKRGAVGVALMSSVLRQSPRGRMAVVGGQERAMESYVHVRQNINGSHAPRGVFLFAGGDFPALGAVDKLCLDTSFSELLRYMIGTMSSVDTAVSLGRSLGIMDPFSTLDIAPTVLSYLGLPVAADMDGRIMDAVFKNAEHTRVARASYADLLQGVRTGMQSPSDDDNERMIEQLRALGYVN